MEEKELNIALQHIKPVMVVLAEGLTIKDVKVEATGVMVGAILHQKVILATDKEPLQGSSVRQMVTFILAVVEVYMAILREQEALEVAETH